jgi:hypothetical protein
MNLRWPAWLPGIIWGVFFVTWWNRDGRTGIFLAGAIVAAAALAVVARDWWAMRDAVVGFLVGAALASVAIPASVETSFPELFITIPDGYRALVVALLPLVAGSLAGMVFGVVRGQPRS